jgi:hypothetical protein
MDSENEPHKEVISCSCGDTFATREKFEKHQLKERKRRFNNRVQDWLDEHVGGRLASWHQDNYKGRGIGSFAVAKREGISTNPDDDRAVRNAAIEYCRGALVEGNLVGLFADAFSEADTDVDDPETADGRIDWYVDGDEIDAVIDKMIAIAESHGMECARLGDGEYNIGRGEGYGITLNRRFH